MRVSVLDRHGIKPEVIETIASLIALIPWPARRQAMAEVTIRLLEAKPRVAEQVFGWSRRTVELGMHEQRTGIRCQNDLSLRRKPKTEEKFPQLLDDIGAIMAPQCQADPQLRTTLAYTNLSAAAVRGALLAKGWTEERLPAVRALSNILLRQGYRLRSVIKTKVQKKRNGPAPFLKTYAR